MSKKVLTLKKEIVLESGETILNPQIAYHTYGKLNEQKSNVVWVCHALTADSDVFSWWRGLVGENDLINPQDYFIICANVLGSHYGTTSPISKNPTTDKSYYHNFPMFTIRDIVLLHKELANHLGIDSIQILIGGSMGGHQAMEWAIQEPKLIKNLVLIATSAIHSPWGVAFNESQRLAIENDSTWKNNSNDAGLNGMKVARSFALISYRNYVAYNNTQQPTDLNLPFPDRAASYQKYQGEKLANRFNAFSYWYLSNAMDSQNVGRNRGGIQSALAKIESKTLAIAIESDLLFPPENQKLLAEHIPNAEYAEIQSDYGHDGFLIETKKITKILTEFLEK